MDISWGVSRRDKKLPVIVSINDSIVCMMMMIIIIMIMVHGHDDHDDDDAGDDENDDNDDDLLSLRQSLPTLTSRSPRRSHHVCRNPDAPSP